MSKDIKQKLQALQKGEMNPSDAWLKSNRDLLLSKIKSESTEEVYSKEDSKFDLKNFWVGMSMFVPRSLVYNVVRPIAVLLLVFAIGTSGWITTVEASYDSLPGEWLYPAKRIMEKAQATVVSVVGSQKSKAKLHVEFATRRADEVNKVVKKIDEEAKVDENTKEQKQKAVNQAVKDIKKELDTVSTGLDSMKDETPGQFAEAVSGVQENTKKIKENLDEVKANLSASGDDEDKSLAKNVDEAKDKSDETTLKAVEAMVAKHLENGGNIKQEDVVNVLNNALDEVTSDVEDNKQEVQNVSDIVENAKTGMAGQTEEASTSTTGGTTVLEKITNASEITKEAGTKTDEAAGKVTETITEAKKLLEEGSLQQVLDKVKEATQANKEVEKIKDEALENVSEVLPIIAKQVSDKALKEAETEKELTNQPAVTTTVEINSVTEIMTSTPAVVEEKKIN